MPIFQRVSRFVTCILFQLRNLASDERCASRIERYLEQCVPGEMAEPIGVGGGEAGARIRRALATMPPLTRAVLAVVVGRRMTVAQVSRRFGMSETRVCWHFRRAILIVAGYGASAEPTLGGAGADQPHMHERDPLRLLLW